MAKVRAAIGQQVSAISQPKTFAMKGFDFAAPISLDQTPLCLITDDILTSVNKVAIPFPFLFDNIPGGEVPIIGRVTSYDVDPTRSMRLVSLDDEAIAYAPLLQQPTPSFDFPVNVVDGFELGLTPFVTTFELPLEDVHLFEPVNVSDNLLKHIEVEKIAGYNYASRYWQVTNLVEEKPRQKKLSSDVFQELHKEDIKPRSRHKSPNTDEKKPPSIWDLIFVVLQPPLELSQTENLLLPHSLFPYQVHGVNFLLTREHALLADDMGTGKTVMTITALKILFQQAGIHHVLIVCPPSVLHEWRQHLDNWASEVMYTFVRGGQETRELTWDMRFHAYVTTYDTLARDIGSGRLSRTMYDFFDVVVLDEAHHIKNPNSRRSRAIKKLRPQRRWALTGTPIQNKLEDLASIFEFVHPNYLTPYDMYPERVKLKIEPFFLRRRKQEVMPELPSKQRQEFWLDMSPKHREEYRQEEYNIQNEIHALGEMVTKRHIFAKLQRLKQICNFSPKSGTSPKLELLKEHVETVIQNEAKIIIFSQYIESGIEKLERSLSSYGIAKIVGGQTDASRRREIERFKGLPNVPILLASIKSGGEGLNLTEASYVVHFDHWWNPATMWQAEDRVHRRGQEKGVNVYSYWMRETVDERIYSILEQKGLLFDDLIDDLSEQRIDESLTIDDLLDVLGIKKIITSTKPVIDVKLWQSLSLSEIRTKLYEITPREFEELIRELMHYLGYSNVKVTGKTGDGGIDVISTRNTPEGIERVAAQCKRYKGNVGVGVARDFLGAITADKSIVKGFLVTTGEFTPDCLHFCEKSGKIQAISGLEVANYVKKFGLRV